MAPRSASVLAAARSMGAFGERVLIVTDEKAGKRVAVGLVTEHELVEGVIARGADPARSSLGEIMDTNPGFVRETDSVFDTIRWMHRNRLREVIVHDKAGRMVGVLTFDQLFDAIAGDFTAPDVPAIEERLDQATTVLH
jgi:signal-transduction protein with cAMP-binding, CBS, and nucleotidyltransferase domain